MKVEEFKEAASAYQKRLFLCMVVPSLIGLVPMGVYLFVRERFETFLAERFELAVAEFLGVLPLAVPNVSIVLVVYFLCQRLDKKSKFPCAGCGGNLLGLGYRAAVLASGNCPRCGGRVIDGNGAVRTKPAE